MVMADIAIAWRGALIAVVHETTDLDDNQGRKNRVSEGSKQISKILMLLLQSKYDGTRRDSLQLQMSFARNVDGECPNYF